VRVSIAWWVGLSFLGWAVIALAIRIFTDFLG
jgi:hypothetical protein